VSIRGELTAKIAKIEAVESCLEPWGNQPDSGSSQLRQLELERRCDAKHIDE
jgi:hypothetical protein